jgi:HEPN domain-containing protein
MGLYAYVFLLTSPLLAFQDMKTNRATLQQLAETRLKESSLLIENHCYDGAYYLAGYAIEGALKACIAKQTKEYDFPDKDEVNKNYTHDLEKLLVRSGLESQFLEHKKLYPKAVAYWAIITKWSEAHRYTLNTSKSDARRLLEAINDQTDGIILWIKKFW